MEIEKDFSEIISYALYLCEPYFDRAHSFDFCYQYFRKSQDVILGDIEKSCYVLWSYLASWGMLRGSTELSQKNPSCLMEVVRYIAENSLSDIDIDGYSSAETRNRIIQAYNNIKRLLKDMAGIETPTHTLVTKIMLGAYSCVPAFDVNFSKYYNAEFKEGCSEINEKVLTNLSRLQEYVQYEPCYMTMFDGTKSQMTYNKIKLLDVYGFNKGVGISIEGKVHREHGNLFEKAVVLNIDGIFAPVYSGRQLFLDEYKQHGVIVPNLIEYHYSRELSKKECRDLYFAQLDALSDLGARRIATYSLYVNDDSRRMIGNEKVRYIHSVIKDWCIKNEKKFDVMYLFDFDVE